MTNLGKGGKRVGGKLRRRRKRVSILITFIIIVGDDDLDQPNLFFSGETEAQGLELVYHFADICVCYSDTISLIKQMLQHPKNQ